ANDTTSMYTTTKPRLNILQTSKSSSFLKTIGDRALHQNGDERDKFSPPQLLADLVDAAARPDWKQPRLWRAHARTIARLFAVVAFCVDNQRAAVARELRKLVHCLEDTLLDFAIAREIAISLVILDVPFAAFRMQRSVALALSWRERKRCVVAVPNALN